jgi:outer membrane protein assembly factor BamB
MKKLILLCVVILFFIQISCARVEFLEPDSSLPKEDRSGFKFVYDQEQYPPQKPKEEDSFGRYLDLSLIKVYPAPVDTSKLIIHPSSEISKHNGYSYSIIHKNQTVSSYKRDYVISFPSPQYYNSVEGILSFRGNNYRNTSAYGLADVKEKKLEIVWDNFIGSIDTWTGVGWTGQPALVKWPEETKAVMNIDPEKKADKDLVEVIYATMDGNIYFLDLKDGKNTRPPINTGFPIKGSVAVDPRGYPLLYSGQGVNSNKGVYADFKFRIFSLIDQKQLYTISGNDPYQYRAWGAFDSCALIDGNTDTLIQAGENGIIYTAKLNTKYNPSEKTISIDPEFTNYRYKTPYGTLGVENSPVGYKNLLYFTDNSGLLHCLDLNTMTPVWAHYVNDDSDATMVLEELSENEVYIYTANEIDLQGPGGSSYMRKFNALTGEKIWEKSIRCYYDKDINGGALASPVLGEMNLSDYIYFNIARTSESPWGGILYCFDKKTGDVVWEKTLGYYCWSSPVAVYDFDQKGYLILCDSGGYMHLIDGKTGETLDKIALNANVEASPAVYENMVVVGTRGQQIFGVRIK